ncbi:DotU family type IV/VI secretion system protein [Klebsiella pasteurii]|uniref:DotU family type IV/VI secretion system protein n=1 Tax=Klebsiella pasteurii TaxID=2587529 RepID=A0ABD5HD05_9ENTR|nr:DotU family type IV/VI secretion system protein [Klebsiella pasteurii]MDW2715758.1 DotU family type IV/VI secretion system protein [Klebsiella pasteurii]
MKTDIDTDALLADAWLTVTELRYGARLAEGDGEALWQHCVEDIAQVMAQLKQAGMSEAILERDVSESSRRRKYSYRSTWLRELFIMVSRR